MIVVFLFLVEFVIKVVGLGWMAGWDCGSIWCCFSSFCFRSWIFYEQGTNFPLDSPTSVQKPKLSGSFVCFLSHYRILRVVWFVTLSHSFVAICYKSSHRGFGLGLKQLRVVRAVAVIGGFLQIALFMCLCSLTAVVHFLYFSHLTYMDSSQAIFTLQIAETIECFVLYVWDQNDRSWSLKHFHRCCQVNGFCAMGIWTLGWLFDACVL